TGEVAAGLASVLERYATGAAMDGRPPFVELAAGRRRGRPPRLVARRLVVAVGGPVHREPPVLALVPQVLRNRNRAGAAARTLDHLELHARRITRYPFAVRESAGSGIQPDAVRAGRGAAIRGGRLRHPEIEAHPLA